MLPEPQESVGFCEQFCIENIDKLKYPRDGP